ncbi:MAG: hypothetical protein R3F35_04880 [Myxococcota bacterium]
MGRRLILRLGGLSVAARVAAAGRPFADAEAGDGYDANLNAAATSSDARGDGFGFVRAALGWIGDGERISPPAQAMDGPGRIPTISTSTSAAPRWASAGLDGVEPCGTGSATDRC